MFVVVTLYGEWTAALQKSQHVLFMVSGIIWYTLILHFYTPNPGVFYYLHSILNPILYTILSKRFRRGFNDMSVNCCVYQVTLVGRTT